MNQKLRAQDSEFGRRVSRVILFLFLCGLLVNLNPSAAHAEEAIAASDGAVPSQPAAFPPGGGNLTLELQGVSIFDVFKILSKKSGLNIVAGKNVQGQVSIFLQDVPVREALRTILQSQGLAAIEENGIIKVMTEEEYLEKFGRPYGDLRAERTFTLKYASAAAIGPKINDLKSPSGKIIIEPRTNSLIVTELPDVLGKMESLIRETDKPQETRVFPLKYALAETLEPKMKALVESGGGRFEIDKRSNRILVSDIPVRLDQAEAIINAFDVQVPQVLIEARIVEVRLSDGFRQGIDWDVIARNVGSAKTLHAVLPLAVSPPVGAAALTTLTLGEEDDDLKLVLSLLEKVGKTNLLSSPRITVLNNEEAKLAVATKQPFVSQTVVQTTNSTNTADNVQFIDVGVTLKVQAKISRDQYVEMKIRPEISSSNSTVELEGVASGSNTTYTRTRIPVVTTQQLETVVQVKSANTLIIGGLIQDRQEKNSSKAPIFGSVPLLGRAFHSRSNDFEKVELVIFLTPTILSADTSDEPESARFWKPGGSAVPFESFGGYPYRQTYLKPLRYAETGEIPYWEDPRGWKFLVNPQAGEKTADQRGEKETEKISEVSHDDK